MKRFTTILAVLGLAVLTSCDVFLQKPDTTGTVDLEAVFGSKKNAEAAVNATFAAIAEGMKAEGKVQLVGFGSFEVKHRAARTALNPKTKAPVTVPAANVPAFKAGKALKDAVK